ncbi:PREDICTED: receptor [Prunus dulcis]|uniref:PREDICTED: receptor n=1 Tax=Prunus dulcis TaxID=3755 RepID=A0A5E4EFT0_PRUDU|nr:PREDICTED: receptor [Prunus dulcis]
MKTLLHYLFLFCFNILLPTVHSQCIKDQQQSLLHLKKSLQFDQPSCRTPLISWNSSTDCCSWVGVTCTSNGHVTGLDRSRKTISGPILGSFANFSNLRLLDLRGNSISSPISGFFANFSNLRLLDLSENNIRGKIHHWIWSSNRLYTLNLSSNYLVTLEAPLLNSTVKTVDLHLNQLQGQIPTSLPYAKYLDYSRNNFNSIPSNIVYLARNNLTASFSNVEVTEDSSLQILEIGGNQLDGKNISTLRVLILRSKNFYGGTECLNTNGTWSGLQIIDLAHNNFSGEIQGILWRTWREMMAAENGSLLTTVVGSHTKRKPSNTICNRPEDPTCHGNPNAISPLDNNFSGPIPKEMGEFKSLRVLNLSRNAFTGEIPSSFGNMRVLESLDPSQNKLSGHIPPQIPTGNQFSTFLNDSFTGNKGLSGFPLTVDNKAGFPPPPTVNGRPPNSGHHREVNWDLIIVEIGFTFGFGVAVGSLVLCKRWSKWYYRAMYNILLKIFPQLEQIIGIHRRHVYIN